MKRFSRAMMGLASIGMLATAGAAPTGSERAEVRSEVRASSDQPAEQKRVGTERATERRRLSGDPARRYRKHGVPWWAIRSKSAGTRQNRRRRNERRTGRRAR